MSIAEQVAEHDWYHAIDLGDGVITPGRFEPHVPPNFTLFPVWEMLEGIDVEGLDCIDIGTTDGIVAFSLKKENAATVVGTDRGGRPTFPLVRDYLGLEVEYMPGSTLDGGEIHTKLAEAGLPTKFDVVVLSGVIYHAYDPLVVLMYARRLLKTNGLIIVETAFHPGDEAALHFNPSAARPVPEPNTYFLPTLSGLHGMLNYISCNSLATITNLSRAAVLAQACRPSEIADRSETLDLIIRKGGHYGPLDFEELEREQAVSSVEYRGRRGTWATEREGFSTRFELQPASA